MAEELYVNIDSSNPSTFLCIEGFLFFKAHIMPKIEPIKCQVWDYETGILIHTFDSYYKAKKFLGNANIHNCIENKHICWKNKLGFPVKITKGLKDERF